MGKSILLKVKPTINCFFFFGKDCTENHYLLHIKIRNHFFGSSYIIVIFWL